MRYSFIAKSVLVILLSVSLMSTSVLAQSTEPEAGANVPKALYVVPFLNAMIPDSLSSHLFDSFIDQMMTEGKKSGISIRILKQDIDSVDKDWLAEQHYITGEMFGYAEDSGCCSTEMKVTVRVYRYQPGSVDPASENVVPGDAFFDHDLSTLEKEHVHLAKRMARKLSEILLAELLPAS